MNSFVSKIGVTLAALALVIAPTTSAIAAGINVSITSPANGSTVGVNQATTFTGSATGGDVSTYSFNWVWGDGTENGSTNVNGQTSKSKTYSTTGAKTVTLNVTDFNGNSGTKSITVTSGTVTNPDSKPVISDVLVASKTQTTATITWKTDIDATSRVIYGLTSQKDPVTGKEIGSAPNYNYTNSQPASVNSSSPKTKTHSVTLTGLTPGTKYFFRVLSAK